MDPRGLADHRRRLLIAIGLAAAALAAAAIAAVAFLGGGESNPTEFRQVGIQGVPSDLSPAQLRELGLGALAERPVGVRMETVLQDDAVLLHRPEILDDALDKIKELGVDRIRITAGWSVLTRDPDSKRKPDFDATDPAAYEQDRWENIDRLVRKAQAKGLKVMIDIAFWAPHWAAGEPAGTPRARHNVNIDAYTDFVRATVKRYSGGFTPPAPKPGEKKSKPSSDEKFLEAIFGGKDEGGGGSGGSGGGGSGGGVPGVTASSTQDEPTDQGTGEGTTTTRGAGGNPVEETLKAIGGKGEKQGEGGGQSGGGGSGGGQPKQDEQPAEAVKEPLPKVQTWTIWNEPNHQGFLMPQWKRAGGRFVNASAHLYRQMLYKAYPAIKQLQPDSTVLVGGLSSIGSHSGQGRGATPPLLFMRELACVDARLKPLRRPECGGFRQIPGDGWAHHPYSLHTEPGARNVPSKPDNAPIGETGKLGRQLGDLVGAGRFNPKLRDLYLTEYGYETNPPDQGEKYTLGDQVKFLAWAEYIAYVTPQVKMFPQFLLRDLPPRAEGPATGSKKRAFGDWQSGLYFADGGPKPAAGSFKAGLLALKSSGGKVLLWARVRNPAIQAPRVEVQGGGAVAARAPIALISRNDGTFMDTVPAARGARYRLSYVEKGQLRSSPSVSPVAAGAPNSSAGKRKAKQSR